MTVYSRSFIALCAMIGLCVTASAEVRVPRMFGDNMVLQQRTSNAVWGIAEPGEKVTLRASWGTSAETVADDDGNWKVLLETPGHGTDHELTINASNSPGRMNQDIRLSPLDQKLIQGGVGLVATVVQVLGQSGLGDLGKQSEERFSRSLDPHDKIQYWAWPATMMRSITAAHAETDHFEAGSKVAMSGGSKNGSTFLRTTGRPSVTAKTNMPRTSQVRTQESNCRMDT